jgi:drug/metabolite transporter (DMT)-like permease
VLLGVILLGEDPSALQLTGVAFILAGLVSVALRRDPSRRPVPEPA